MQPRRRTHRGSVQAMGCAISLNALKGAAKQGTGTEAVR
jgi:hypothetical protein